MKKLIDLTAYPVKPVLRLLLTDKTTKKNIVFATKSYEQMGKRYTEDSHITEDVLLGINRLELQPRVLKQLADQADRTKKRAEVMV